jgi:hypothetical protein
MLPPYPQHYPVTLAVRAFFIGGEREKISFMHPTMHPKQKSGYVKKM